MGESDSHTFRVKFSSCPQRLPKLMAQLFDKTDELVHAKLAQF